MEPPDRRRVPPDRDSTTYSEKSNVEAGAKEGETCTKSTIPPTTITPALAATATTYSAATHAVAAFSGTSIGRSLFRNPSTASHQHASTSSLQQSSHLSGSLLSQRSIGGSIVGMGSSTSLYQHHTGQQNLEKLSRPVAFDKMESLVREMQDPEHGVPVRQQKMFLTSIPYAFMGYDLIEWLMDRLLIEESEALNIANQLCLHGYFFPVNDTKTLTVKDDSSLYRFQTPYYWPWQHKTPDNVEYAIYLVKRSMRNKQRHALEDYELEALGSLHKNLKGKWEIIKMQAEEQVRLAKERKKGDKIVGDSQERAYWRVYRPPPGHFTPLEPCPVPSRDRLGPKQNKKKALEDVQREVDYLRKSLNRTRMKMSQACETLVAYSETFVEYDFFLQPVLPSNPWITEDTTFWQLNNTFVDIPTEKRVKRWAISIEELVSDPTGLQEFTMFLEKEYSHENIRFWIAVNRLRRSAHSQVSQKVQDIYEEFLKPGAPCEINIDGKTMESVLKGLTHPSRFTFDAASEHIYMLLLKKDCYPRFVRSEHYKRLLETGIQPAHKKRFFNFGGVSGAKKKMTAALSSQGNMGGHEGSKAASTAVGTVIMQGPTPSGLMRRRGSDRSLSGSAHELAIIGVNKDSATNVPHSHSQSNLSEIPYSEMSIYRGDMTPQQQCHLLRKSSTPGSCLMPHQEPPKLMSTRLDSVTDAGIISSAVCPWDVADETVELSDATGKAFIQLSVCPWEQEPEVSSNVSKGNVQRLTSTSSDNSETHERTQRNLVIHHQHTVDSGDTAIKRLLPISAEQRRASVSFTPSRLSELPLGLPPAANKVSITPSPTVSTPHSLKFPTLFKPLQVAQSATAVAAMLGNVASTATNITKDPPSNSDTEMDELSKLSLSERNSESSSSELPVLPTPILSPTPPPITKITPPPPPPFDEETLTAAIESKSQLMDDINYIVSPSDSPQNDVKREELEVKESQKLETEVDVEIQEIQIELIETSTEQLCEGQDPLIVRTTTTTHVIQIEGGEYNNAQAGGEELSTKPDRGEEDNGNKKENKELFSNFGSEKDREQPENLVIEVEPTINKRSTETVLKLPEGKSTAQLYSCQEELSPTTDEYHEGLQFGAEDKEVCSYGLGETKGGYIAPAPTPAPAMAPLAEIDTDTVDDEPSEDITFKESPTLPSLKLPLCPTTKYHSEEARRRRKKKHIDGKKLSSMEEKEREREKEEEASTSKAHTTKDSGAKPDSDIATVCPWEDEVY